MDKVVVVHRGARDSYEAARAMQEAGMLERLVTDFYWPGDTAVGHTAAALLPVRVKRAVEFRSNPGVPSDKVDTRLFSGLASAGIENSPLPFTIKRKATRWTDTVLGRTAGQLATERQAALLSYSYYGHSAFGNYRGSGARILFQLHPHPVSMRRILSNELAHHPDCAESLSKEWELSLPEEDFQLLVEEPLLAEHWIAASSFTRQTLIENGASAENIHIVPYGVDGNLFNPGAATARAVRQPLQLLFVGIINQRKGIKYLLEALRQFDPRDVQLRVCGRVVDDLRLFQPFGPQIRLTPSVSRGELIEAYRTSDLFVFPSVAEGFGQVLLESLACGLPIVSTNRTAAPDLIADGEAGFLVPPCDPGAIAERIRWALENREQLAAMRSAARRTAEQFTWNRFRSGLAAVVKRCMTAPRASKAVLSHV